VWAAWSSSRRAGLSWAARRSVVPYQRLTFPRLCYCHSWSHCHQREAVQAQNHRHCCPSRLQVDLGVVRPGTLVVERVQQHVQASRLVEVQVQRRCLRCLIATHGWVVVLAQQCAKVRLWPAEELGLLLCAAYRSSLGLRRCHRYRRDFVSRGVEGGLVLWKALWIVVRGRGCVDCLYECLQRR
jgi:hypothetical protein